jgi:chemotaxis protein MotB
VVNFSFESASSVSKSPLLVLKIKMREKCNLILKLCNTFHPSPAHLCGNIYLKFIDMKNALNILVFLSLALGIIFSSCVSSKKFEASEANVDKLQKENVKTQEQLAKCNKWANDINNENEALKNRNVSVQSDMKELASESASTIADQEKHLKRLNNIIFMQKEVLNDLRKSISDALIGYNTDELSILAKDGNIYVLLEEKLLFKTGSAEVDVKGKQALKTLANVLNSTPDVTVMVEGHTDNVDINSSKYKDNWDLSVARATAIVRIVSYEYGFNPNRITASGKGKFHPVQTNETEAGRAANRRIEIILTPNMNELFNLLYK